jgi:hypothetical protein
MQKEFKYEEDQDYNEICRIISKNNKKEHILRRIRDNISDISLISPIKSRFQTAESAINQNLICLSQRPIKLKLDDEVPVNFADNMEVANYINTYQPPKSKINQNKSDEQNRNLRYERKLKSSYTILEKDDNIAFCLCPYNIYNKDPCYHTISYLYTDLIQY